GSRGSKVLTEAAVAAQRSCPDVQFLIVTGEGELRTSSDPHIVFVPYIHEMGVALATADVVICRAGAATLAELAALGKPAIVVPWPRSAGDHQTANAKQLAQSNFVLVPESELTPGRLVQEIHTALHLKPHRPSPQRADALHHILREVLLDATSTRNTPALYRDRRRRHEWVGQSLF
ncbi:MAG: glycosyltransferase, partial [Candidatus Bipolaricaulia bacterium]